MNSGMDTIRTDADKDPAWVAAKSDEQIEDLMHTPSSEDHRANHGNEADIMVTIAKCEIGELNADEADHIHAERTQVEVQFQLEEPLLDILQLGNNAASNWSEISSTWCLERTKIELLSPGASDDIFLSYRKR